jgi:hypothetical protein
MYETLAYIGLSITIVSFGLCLYFCKKGMKKLRVICEDGKCQTNEVRK